MPESDYSPSYPAVSSRYLRGVNSLVLFTGVLATLVLLFFALYAPWLRGEAGEKRSYVVVWLLCIPSAALLALRLARPPQATVAGDASALLASITWLATLSGSLFFANYIYVGQVTQLRLLLLASLPAAFYVCLRPKALLSVSGKSTTLVALLAPPIYLLAIAAPFMWSSRDDYRPLQPGLEGYWSWNYFVALLVGATSSIALYFDTSWSSSKWRALIIQSKRFPAIRIMLHVLIVVIMGTLCIDTAWTTDRHHHNWFLGPANDLLVGKALMVDSNSSYGIGPPYLLCYLSRLGLINMMYDGLGYLVGYAYAFQYAVVYAVLVVLTRSIRLSILGAIVVVLFSCIGSFGSGSTYPSTGALRFGPPLFLAAALSMRHGAMGYWRPAILSLLEATAFGVCMLWSLESCIFGLITYVAFYGTDTMMHLQRGRRHRETARFVRSVLKQGALNCGFALPFTTLFVFDTYKRCGKLPDFASYCSVVLGLADYSSLPMDGWHPWGVVALPLAMVGGLWIVLALHPKVVARFPAVYPVMPGLAAFCGLGASQFQYYIGRSVFNNLYHVSVIPAIVVTTICGRLITQHSSSRQARYFGMLVLTSAAAFSVFSNHLEFGKHLSDSVLGKSLWAAGLLPSMYECTTPPAPPVEAVVAQAVSLSDKYCDASRRIYVCIDMERTTEVHLRSATASPFPIATPSQETSIPLFAARIRSAPLPMKHNDVIVILKKPYPGTQTVLQKDIAQLISHAFREEVIEETTAGVCAVRLYAR